VRRGAPGHGLPPAARGGSPRGADRASLARPPLRSRPRVLLPAPGGPEVTPKIKRLGEEAAPRRSFLLSASLVRPGVLQRLGWDCVAIVGVRRLLTDPDEVVVVEDERSGGGRRPTESGQVGRGMRLLTAVPLGCLGRAYCASWTACDFSASQSWTRRRGSVHGRQRRVRSARTIPGQRCLGTGFARSRGVTPESAGRARARDYRTDVLGVNHS
jgi:hypothetical protein